MSTRPPIPNDVFLFAPRWWLTLLRGIFAVTLGVLILTRPGVTLPTLGMCFAVYALLDGFLLLLASLRNWRHQEKCWLLGMEGFAGICAGSLAFWVAMTTPFRLLLLVAGWIFAMGLLGLAGAIHLRHQIAGEVWLMLSGVATILFGSMILLWPVVGVIALIWVLAVYAFVLGAFLIVMGIKMRRRRITVYGGLHMVK